MKKETRVYVGCLKTHEIINGDAALIGDRVQAAMKKLTNPAARNTYLRGELDYQWDEDNNEILVYGIRMETDYEEVTREAHEAKIKAEREERAERNRYAREKEELATYLKLKEKYEPKADTFTIKPEEK